LEFNEQLGAARTYRQLGRVAQEQRRFEDAEQAYRRAVDLFLELNDRYNAALTYQQLGLVAQEQRRFEDALEYSVRAADAWHHTTGVWPKESLQTIRYAASRLNINDWEGALSGLVATDLLNDLILAVSDIPKK
jgi:tetratricopeptide (TPR) repeat protein